VRPACAHTHLTQPLLPPRCYAPAPCSSGPDGRQANTCCAAATAATALAAVNKPSPMQHTGLQVHHINTTATRHVTVHTQSMQPANWPALLQDSKSRGPHQQASKQHRCLAKPQTQQGASRTNPYRQDVCNKHNKPRTTQASMLPILEYKALLCAFPSHPCCPPQPPSPTRCQHASNTRPSPSTQAPTQAGTQPRSLHTA
jgi:hypothetical protein